MPNTTKYLLYSSLLVSLIIIPTNATAQKSSTKGKGNIKNPIVELDSGLVESDPGLLGPLSLVAPTNVGLSALGEEIQDVEDEIESVDAQLKNVEHKIDLIDDYNKAQIKNAQKHIADLYTAGRALTQEELDSIKSYKKLINRLKKDMDQLESEQKLLETKKKQLEKERDDLIVEYNKTTVALREKEDKEVAPSASNDSMGSIGYHQGDKFTVYAGYSYFKTDALTNATEESAGNVSGEYDSDESGNAFSLGVRYKGFNVNSEKQIQPYIGLEYEWIDGISSEESFHTEGLNVHAMRNLDAYALTLIGGLEIPLTKNGRWSAGAGLGARYQKNTLDFSASVRDMYTGQFLGMIDMSESNSGFVPYVELALIYDTPEEGQGGWRGEVGLQAFKFEITDPVQEKDYSDTPIATFARLTLSF